MKGRLENGAKEFDSRSVGEFIATVKSKSFKCAHAVCKEILIVHRSQSLATSYCRCVLSVHLSFPCTIPCGRLLPGSKAFLKHEIHTRKRQISR